MAINKDTIRWTLGLLLETPEHWWSLAELRAALSIDESEAQDAVAELAHRGLADQSGKRVAPARAAVECDRLLL